MIRAFVVRGEVARYPQCNFSFVVSSPMGQFLDLYD